MRKTLLTMATIVLCGHGASSFAADPKAGAALSKAKGCIGCHGANAISPEGTSYPNLAGQKAAYLVKALKAYRDKARQAPLMNGMAASLSDADIANLAAHYAGLKPCP